jgi:hypothetical protein
MTKRVELKDGFILIKGATDEQLRKIITAAREKIDEYEKLIKEIELLLRNPEDKNKEK